MKMISWHSLSLCCSVLIVVTGVQTKPASASKPSTESTQQANYERQWVWRHQWGWTVEKWTGNLAKFTNARNSITKAANDKKKLLEMAQHHKNRVQTKRSDVLSIFYWTYTSLLGSEKHYTKDRTDFVHAAAIFLQTPSPHNYEWTRLHYLIVAERSPNPELRNVGERLLNMNPMDMQVTFYHLNNLNPGTSNKDRSLALRYINRLLRYEPARPSVYSAVGWLHFRIWLVTKDPIEGNKAIQGYTKFIRLARADDPFKHQAAFYIRMISRKMSKTVRKFK